MFNRLLIAVVFISILFSSCKNAEKEMTAKNYTEQDKGDSILYYKDFDLYSFHGIDQLKVDSLSYPFVKMVYQKDSLLLKAHYSPDKNKELLLYKLNNQWCHHWKHWSDGVTSHFFMLFTDTALYEFRYHRNPYGNTNEDVSKPATLYSITVESKKEDIVNSRYYQSFDWGSENYKTVQGIHTTNEKEWLNKCQSLILGNDKIENDTIQRTYQSFERKYSQGKYQQLEKDGSQSLIKIPLILHSEFYTKFLKLGN